ncbi:hypothetical protein CPB83DRAFT_904854 [Crepidotus variabilis]|uniref:Uncharacterized protein n=1 Tax=Crepidotus variabilis TaxID=179855 RepID=A0A9P6JSK4_9AGAR|nr:hypothetical protein CPB83DRAFT_904854 [Crepidotus variabilis]
MQFSKTFILIASFVLFGQGVTCSPLRISQQLQARSELTELNIREIVEAYLERRLESDPDMFAVERRSDNLTGEQQNKEITNATKDSDSQSPGTPKRPKLADATKNMIAIQKATKNKKK